MTAQEVLTRLTAAGIRATAKDGKIIASPRSALTPELLTLVRDHRAALLGLLAAKKEHGLPQVEDELRALVDRVAYFHGFTDEDRREALSIALGDPVAALECFRALVAEMPARRPL